MKYSTVIVGGGPGGYSAAIRLSQLGKRVALVEKKAIGGICLNEGCIPTKTLAYASSLIDKFKKGSAFGISATPSLDFSRLMAKKEATVNRLKKGLETLIKLNKIDYYQDEAIFLSPFEIELKGTKTRLEGETTIIATGSKAINPFPFSLNSSEILELKSLPASLAIIGGGYIGCEFASLFSLLGTKVFIIESQETLLPFLSDNIKRHLLSSLRKRGVEIFLNANLKNISEEGKVFFDDRELSVEKVLVSIGREPLSSGLPKEIRLGPSKEVIVDEFLETSVKNVFAIGDVTKKIMLAHVAIHQGLSVANIIGKAKDKVDYNNITFITFTVPEVAAVGTNKGQSALVPFQAIGKAVSEGEEGLAEIFFQEDGKIVGAQVVGEHASSVIMEMALALKSGLTISDIGALIHPHPTFSEIWQEAALLAEKRPLHLLL